VRAETIVAVLEELHESGIRIALDDFGTGYSSLAYLRRLPLDFVKIDRSFVKDLEGHDADTAIVRAITDLAHTLGLTTIAEGVETQAQADVLAELGCALAQGYLFSRPRPATDADSLLDPLEAVRPLGLVRPLQVVGPLGVSPVSMEPPHQVHGGWHPVGPAAGRDKTRRPSGRT
jgi:EAL domain-containing protein (putative c-di-GMP-specific phosphodiesterase class I)